MFRTDVTCVIRYSPTWMNGMFMLELLFTSYNQEFCLPVIHHYHDGNHPAPQFCHTIFNGSDWVCSIRGRNGSEWQVNLMVIGIALGFWEVLFYDQHMWWTAQGQGMILVVLQWSVSCFFSERVPLSCICWVLWERYDMNHFKAVPPTPKPEPKFSNKILCSIVSNAALMSIMTRRVTFWSSMLSKISDCTLRSAVSVSVLWNGL